MRDHVLFQLNGERRTVRGKDVFLPLSSYLRYELGLTGTKVVCSEGDCAACTVLRAFPGEEFQSLNSCIAPVGLFDGAHLVTVEGLAENGEPTEVQKKMIECHGGQCGFCTPGFVMAITNLYEHHEKVDEKKARNYLTGNLCRCTGYQPILKAATSVDPKRIRPLKSRYLTREAVRDLEKATRSPFRIEDGGKLFLGPTTPAEAARALKKEKGLRILGSATDLGVQCNKEKLRLDRVLTLHKVRGFRELRATKTEIRVGAGVDLTRLEKAAEKAAPSFARFLRVFASLPIKNAATLAGNVANASPIGDTLPFLFLTEAKLELQSAHGKRTLPITKFYKGYKKTDLRPGELIARIRIPLPKKTDRLQLYKISQRRDLDISAVNAGFLARVKKDRIESIRISYGGVAATTLRLPRTEAFLARKRPTNEVLLEAQEILQREIAPLTDARGTEAFRRMASEGLFHRFFTEEGLRAP